MIVHTKTEPIETSEEPAIYFKHILDQTFSSDKPSSDVFMILLSLNGNSYLLQNPLMGVSSYKDEFFQYMNGQLQRREFSLKNSAFDILNSLLKKLDGQKLFGFFSYEFLECIEPQIEFNKPDLYKTPRFLGLLFSDIWQLAPVKSASVQSGIYQGQRIQISIQEANGKKVRPLRIKESEDFEKIFQSSNSCLNISWKQIENDVDSILDKETYLNKVSEVRACIRRGDFYQANLTNLFSRKSKKHLLEKFFSLFTSNPTNYFCFLQTPYWEVLSTSPESFLFTEEGGVFAQPIKGTSPYTENRSSLQDLLRSSKNAAELNMITDLMRNDLQKVSEIGSVKVLSSKSIIEMKNVFHLYSQVRGQMKKSVNSLDLIKAAFPSGSVTGCPKLKSVEWLKENEPYQRGIYTGSLGWLSQNELHLNVAIRTMIQKNGRCYFQVGGGITWDSDPNEEWNEILAKAAPFFKDN